MTVELLAAANGALSRLAAHGTVIKSGKGYAAETAKGAESAHDTVQAALGNRHVLDEHISIHGDEARRGTHDLHNDAEKLEGHLGNLDGLVAELTTAFSSIKEIVGRYAAERGSAVETHKSAATNQVLAKAALRAYIDDSQRA
jgi:hypothetical protein